MYEERRSYLMIGTMFVNNKGRSSCLDVGGEVFDNKVVEEELFFTFASEVA
jgi:hypothetical protein